MNCPRYQSCGKTCLFTFAIVFFLLTPLFGFDSAKWLSKRDLMEKDAKRLQAAYSNAVKRIVSPSEGLTIPLETYPNGAIRTSVFAKKAQFFENSTLVWADGMVITKLDTDGVEKQRLEASRCLIDRLSKTGWIEGHAKLTQGKTTFEGDGVYFSSSNNFVSAFSNSDLKSADLKFGGIK